MINVQDIISNNNDANTFLEINYKNDSILLYINTNAAKWVKNEWQNIELMESDFNGHVKNIYNELIRDLSDCVFNNNLLISIECLLLNQLHDLIVPNLYANFESQDNQFFEKSNELCEITAEQFGAPAEFAIQLSAAVVELANLDARKTVLEKLNCLCTTYDLIFAELKSEIVEVIAKSGKENDIPIIENCAIVPILMTVLIRSKLVHIISNFYFIEAFTRVLLQNEHIIYVLQKYKTAIENIFECTKNNLQPSCDQICKDLDFKKFMRMSNELDLDDDAFPLINNQTRKLTKLITASTDDLQIN